MNEKVETGCCPRFDPNPWDEKQISWQDKLFMKDCVWCFFHVPLNMNGVMLRSMDKIRSADAFASEPVLLYDARSMWRADVYLAVDREVPDAEMTRISGDFLTKVYEGPYKDCGKWAKDMKEYVKAKERELRYLYFFYTTCPKCAEAYGENYTVLLAKV